MPTSESKTQPTISIGVPQLDQVLGGGLTSDRLYLIEGSPGTGKTTLGMQFLLEGVRLGEPTLYITLSETKQELTAVATSHGWSCDGIEIYELVDPSNDLDPDAQYAMFEPSEIELGHTIQGVLKEVERIEPRRVVVDSLSEMRLLAQSPLRYRRQVLALKQFFAGRGCTVLMLDDLTSASDHQLKSIAHGVILLEQILNDYGIERRRLRVIKYRGRKFQGGNHDFRLEHGGIKVYPRKQWGGDHVNKSEAVLSGNAALDALLGGGLEPGSSTLFLGPAGVGKSTCSTLYAHTAATRGERSAFFLFEESPESLFKRAAGLGMDLAPFIESGLVMIHRMDPGELSPGEFTHYVREAVEPDEQGRTASVVVIDSLNGYMNAMPHERHLTVQMHELLMYLSGKGAVTFLVVAQHGMVGHGMATPVDASYLADNVVLFRYFETSGEIRQAISVVKKRSGSHERTIREFSMKGGELTIGEPLSRFAGVLTGIPTYKGDHSELLRGKP